VHRSAQLARADMGTGAHDSRQIRMFEVR